MPRTRRRASIARDGERLDLVHLRSHGNLASLAVAVQAALQVAQIEQAMPQVTRILRDGQITWSASAPALALAARQAGAAVLGRPSSACRPGSGGRGAAAGRTEQLILKTA